jgi:hypothetical protein
MNLLDDIEQMADQIDMFCDEDFYHGDNRYISNDEINSDVRLLEQQNYSDYYSY